MVSREEMQKRLLATFREEAAEHLQVLTLEVDALAAAPADGSDREHVNALFRVVHTLKGAARSVRSSDIEAACQESEYFLQRLTRGEVPIDSGTVRTLRVTLDRLQILISNLFSEGSATKLATAPSPAPVPSPPPPTPAENEPPMAERVAPAATAEPSAPVSTEVESPSLPWAGRTPPARPEIERPWKPESVRVDIGRLDRLMQIAEDLLMPSLVAKERVQAARHLTEQLASLRGDLRKARFSPKAAGRQEAPGPAVLARISELEMLARQLSAALADDSKVLRSVVDNLLQETKQARMMPVSAMLAAFPAMVKDLGRELGKDVKLRLRETNVEIDRKVIELVKDPLMHIVRNAVDHGVEAPAEREAAGKAKRGRITISVRSVEGGWVIIEVADDGRGLNMAALRDAIARSNLVAPARIATLSDDEALNFAFAPGVSTKSVITSLSGLGLGLAIVREQIERVDGKVEIRTVASEGTTIRLEVPASVVSYRGLLVSVGNQKMLWPAETVERVIGISRQEATTAARSGVFIHDGEALPFGDLGTVIFGQAIDRSREPRPLVSCVLARSGSRGGIFIVDDVHGEMEVLVKDLPLPLRRVRNISATGLLASGQLALILRPSDLLVSLRSGAMEATQEANDTRPARVLVVDDSITTRTMERNLFEAAGYDVLVAADGLEAWNILQAEPVDIVVSDIDMPGLDGFDLTARIRAHKKLTDMPVVLVTALETREDKERGILVGANAYVLKSSFDQSNLLQIVGRLV
jgi:two-component system chemotaxis sensor kinase CheA